MKYIILLGLVFISSFVISQSEVVLRRSYHDAYHEEYYVVTEVTGSINYSPLKYYSWYKNQKIHVSQGTSGGYLLHGVYVKYASSHAILERGVFKAGLKDGLWRKWNLEGRVIEQTNWKDGVIHGSSISNSDTLLYKNGSLHGMAFQNKDGVRSFGKYKNGIKKGKWIEGSDTLFYKHGQPQKFEPFFKRLFKKKEKSDKKKDDNESKTGNQNSVETKEKKSKKDKKEGEKKDKPVKDKKEKKSRTKPKKKDVKG